MAKRRKRMSLKKMIRSIRKSVRTTVYSAIEQYSGLDMGIASRAQNKRVNALIQSAGATAAPQVYGQANDKQYGGLTVSLGKKILAMGQNVPGELQGYAREAAAGSGSMPEQQILRKLREGLGIERSGATAFDRFQNQVRNTVQTGARVGVLFNAAQQGGAVGASAQMGLAQMGLDKIEALATSKTMEKVLVTAADKIFKNPIAGQQMFYAIGRGLRLGGGAITAAIAIAMGFEAHFSNNRREAKAESSVYDMARAAGVNYSPEIVREQRAQIANNVEKTNPFDVLMDRLGFGGALAEKKAQAQNQAVQAFVMARDHAARLGIDAGALLTSYAAAKGMKVNQLNARQRNEVLNKAVAAKMKETASTADAERYARTQAKLAGMDTMLWTLTNDPLVTGEPLRAQLSKFRQEFAERQAARAAGEGERIASEIERERTRKIETDPRFIEQIHSRIMAGQYKIQNERQRHAVVWND